MKIRKIVDIRRAIASPSNWSRMTETTNTPIAAAINPCTNRIASNISKLGEMLQASENIAAPTVAVSRTGLRPKRSDKGP